MGKRRTARELALKMLFQTDIGELPPEEVIKTTLGITPLSQEVSEFSCRLLQGVIEHQAEVDLLISQYASGWTLDRMANVDRNILRLALFEILYLREIPFSVSINEAVELAKAYSTAESGKFINGILGNVVRATKSA